MTERVLDHGYVRLVDKLGGDLSVVNAARVSFAKESVSFQEGDGRLLRFLVSHNHTSPYRHAAMTLEVFAPLMVARQWWKYIVGSDHTMDAWNESSRRYVTEGPTYYVIGADAWRSAPTSAKQGSGQPIDASLGWGWTRRLVERYEQSIHDYEEAVAGGICVEQARAFLHANTLYARWRWTGSLQSVCHFLEERLADDAQWEIRCYAQAVERLARENFPAAVAAWLIR